LSFAERHSKTAQCAASSPQDDFKKAASKIEVASAMKEQALYFATAPSSTPRELRPVRGMRVHQNPTARGAP